MSYWWSLLSQGIVYVLGHISNIFASLCAKTVMKLETIWLETVGYRSVNLFTTALCETMGYRTTQFQMHMHSHTNELYTPKLPASLILFCSTTVGGSLLQWNLVWKLKPERHLIVRVVTFEWRLVDLQKSWSRATQNNTHGNRSTCTCIQHCLYTNI